jgi:cell division protein ZapA (FtsZ GTPase activity inhibitor)
MPPEMTNVTVRIYGWDYVLKVNAAQEERVKAIADYLDQKMNLVAARGGTADTLKIAIRAGLLITDELFDARDKQDAVMEASLPEAGETQPETTPLLDKSENQDDEIDSKLNALSDLLDKELGTL